MGGKQSKRTHRARGDEKPGSMKTTKVSKRKQTDVGEQPEQRHTSHSIRNLGPESQSSYRELPEGAKFVEETEFKSPFAKNTPISLTQTKKISLEAEVMCSWATMFNDRVAVGYLDSGAVDIVNINGTIIEHWLPEGGRVVSGVYLDKEKCLISVDLPNMAYTCNINPLSNISTKPGVLNTLSVVEPICVFPMGKFQYGVLCQDPYRIEIFSKRSLYTDNKPKPQKILNIDIPDIAYLTISDRVCCTPDERIFVMSEDMCTIYIYNPSGSLIKTTGFTRLEDETVPGGLETPKSIESTEDGTIVLTDWKGAVQTYRDGKKGWGIVKSRDGVISRTGVLSNTRFWMVRHITNWSGEKPNENYLEVYELQPSKAKQIGKTTSV